MESAIQVLKRAIELDQKNKYSEALTCYEQGIAILHREYKKIPDDVKKEHYRQKIEEYLKRAEKIKEKVVQLRSQQTTHRQINIPAGEYGYSYETVFGPLIDDFLTHVSIEDPYIQVTHQILNFLRFCELLVWKATSLKSISLRTKLIEDKANNQKEMMEEIQKSLRYHNVVLDIKFEETLHDREIRFNNGWIIKIGRGLDYFQRVNQFSIGFSNYHLRPCKQTTIDIFPGDILQTEK